MSGHGQLCVVVTREKLWVMLEKVRKSFVRLSNIYEKCYNARVIEQLK
jgi:hypothetical protein